MVNFQQQKIQIIIKNIQEHRFRMSQIEYLLKTLDTKRARELTKAIQNTRFNKNLHYLIQTNKGIVSLQKG